ncbi:hypothetical protein GCM10025768_03000 [Microbacterium pseudoresistens]|uniref:Nitrite reductase (NO-forming) n=1 Tax=Microbacterium pseudoresistens TaxID=640634 RepID=A0A7Y9EUQ1_9MICO|nr:nitrite reductase (NO-forming) [Microbacterium pseudoresistens]
MSRSPRRLVTLPGVLAVALLAVSGCASGPDAEPTGHTTEVTVSVQGMHFVPDVIEVPVGDELVVTFENTGDQIHDLVFDNGTGSDRVPPGQQAQIDVGVVAAHIDGWCSVSNHRAMGMELTVRAVE